jgi:hypothetical protein
MSLLNKGFKAIFSTPFFDFHAEIPKPIMSPWFSVYWAITVPLTLGFLVMWYFRHLYIRMIKMRNINGIEKREEIERREEEMVRRLRMQPLDYNAF